MHIAYKAPTQSNTDWCKGDLEYPLYYTVCCSFTVCHTELFFVIPQCGITKLSCALEIIALTLGKTHILEILLIF